MLSVLTAVDPAAEGIGCFDRIQWWRAVVVNLKLGLITNIIIENISYTIHIQFHMEWDQSTLFETL